MYNPYNWKIVPETEAVRKECKRLRFENDYEYFQRLLSTQAKYYAKYSINKMSYELSLDNLRDSIGIENESGEINKTVDFDLKNVISARKMLKKTEKKIKYIDFLINSIYK